ncbi:MAG: hypothetical protein ACR2GH_06575 [Pseudonocardia sp.]
MTSVPDTPLHPDDLPSTVPLNRLLDGYLDHSRRVVRARTRAHVELQSQTRADVAQFALAGLVCAGVLVDRVATDRWHLAHEALTHGATVDDLATAAGLDIDEIQVGLASWADTERAHGRLTQNEHNVILELIECEQDDPRRRRQGPPTPRISR